MKTISFQITLLEPALISAPGGDPNANTSLTFIPGSVIRGALIQAYLQTSGANEKDLQKWFLSGQVKFLPAYPVNPEGVRSLPAPNSLVEDKSKVGDDPHKITNRLREKPPQTPKGLGGFGYLSDDKTWTPVKAQTEVAVHTTRDRAFGRAGDSTKDQEGGVFQYHTLARGSVFCSHILIPDDVAAAETQLTALLGQQTYRFGGSISAGHGLAKLKVLKNPFQREVPGTLDTPIQADQTFTLTLLSDAIIHNPDGQPSDDLLSGLERVLGAGTTLTLLKAYRRFDWVGGFHSHWGLPLYQDWSIRAGGSYLLKANRELTASELRTLEEQGIGERCADGFGRVAVNWILPSHLKKGSDFSGPPETTIQDELCAKDNQLLEKMKRRHLEAQLDRIVAATISEYLQKMNLDHVPRNSQIARLRLICRQAAQEGSMAKLKTYLDNAKLRKVVREQLQSPRIDGMSLFNWLYAWTEPDTGSAVIWQKLGTSSLTYLLPEEDKWESEQALQVKYQLRLIDGVLARLMKEKGSEA